MKRIQLFEFEDFSWFPGWIRSSMTNLIAVLHKMMGTKEVLSDLILKVHEQYQFDQVVDMGSGSGGIMPEVIQHFNAGTEISLSLILTDLYPNRQYIAHINDQQLEHIQYQEDPLDATNLSQAPQGLKTMINSFHHMPPLKAKAILKSAQDTRQPLLIYEIAENKMPLLVWWLLLPISLILVFVMALLMTPFSRLITLKQLVFTYLIPIIPICYAWDGQASLPRMYTFKDINELLEGVERNDYTWEMKIATKSNGKKLGYYILGLPK